MIGLLIYLIIVALLAWLLFYIVSRMGLPEPVRTIVLIIGAIVLLLVLLNGFGVVGEPVIVYPRR